MRLIDADALEKGKYHSNEFGTQAAWKQGWNDAIDAIINYAETVDIDAITESHERDGYDRGFRDGYAQATSEVKHGHWILSEDRYFKTCSECGAEVDVSMGLGIFVDDIRVDEMNYCPNCGAYMGVEDETD